MIIGITRGVAKHSDFTNGVENRHVGKLLKAKVVAKPLESKTVFARSDAQELDQVRDSLAESRHPSYFKMQNIFTHLFHFCCNLIFVSIFFSRNYFLFQGCCEYIPLRGWYCKRRNCNANFNSSRGAASDHFAEEECWWRKKAAEK